MCNLHISWRLALVKKNVHIAHVPDLLDTLFAPFARLMVARGVLFPELVERLKAHYLAAAVEQSEGKVTDSRISVLTGLQRRDIARLKSEPRTPVRSNHLATLVARWRTDPAYLAQDIPKNGAEPSFEALARDIRRDVHPRTMLDTLLSAGTVETLDNDILRLSQTSYQPLAGSEDQLAYLTRNLGDHMSAATDNVMGKTPAHFERAVHYGGLTMDQLLELKEEHERAQMAVFETLADKAAAMKAGQKADAEYRFRAGAYFYRQRDKTE
ncbi:DUF6502 family protein [Ruegeria meonggei]|uniref:Uncharacterized protein n=1 Tax=Ruegeria meonggei TaxID=1446476 RepID=A0A1X6ZLZ9_9RHOB|nr:DUF6502 family protein [Ruegeria meonggei]SLN55666.1 hypothetical protein RUM8411_02706 [Ruegeria meonggei]